MMMMMILIIIILIPGSSLGWSKVDDFLGYLLNHLIGLPLSGNIKSARLILVSLIIIRF